MTLKENNTIVNISYLKFVQSPAWVYFKFSLLNAPFENFFITCNANS